MFYASKKITTIEFSKNTEFFKRNTSIFPELGFIKNEDSYTLFLDQKLTGVMSFGKKIIFILEKYFFVLSFGLKGKLLPGEYAIFKIKLNFENNTSISYINEFKNYEFTFLKIENLMSYMKRHTIDIYNPEFTIYYFLNIFSKYRGQRVKIVDFITDHNNFSGIGACLKSEILYHANIHPLRLISSLTDSEKIRIYHSIIYISDIIYRYGGSKYNYSNFPFFGFGKYEPLCYGRKTDFDGKLIILHIDRNNSRIYYCPEKQK